MSKCLSVLCPYLQQEDLRLQVDLFESLLSVCGLSNAQGMGLVRNSLSHFKNTAKWLGVAESLESMRALHKVRWWIFHKETWLSNSPFDTGCASVAWRETRVYSGA